MEKIWTPEKEFPYEIEGLRIRLQVHDLSDKHVKEAVRTERENLDDIKQWMFAGNFATEEKARSFIRDRAEFFRQKYMASYAVYLKEDGKYIGLVDFLNVGGRVGDVSYYIDRAYRNKGYMSEAVGALERTFFALGFERILLECNINNKPSVRLAVKMDYKYEASEMDEASPMVNFYKGAGR
ncbi:MAG: GNAT family N-acetyltransferase [Rickettsiales bacterium]|jgi:RimJ/RimL family protein N-acetyltransferase|nr:GNAT family N-acetyltransferase [Rickettsiales bacterium]